MKRFYTLLSAVLLSASLWAQAPQSFSYQAVMRGANNELVVNKPVGMKISLLQGSENGSAIYVETHNSMANANGLVSIAIGAGAKLVGDFISIDWSKGPYFVKTETDLTGGTSYTLIATSQLLSVPFALYAANSQSGPKGEPGAVGPQGLPGKDGVEGKEGPIGPKGDTGAVGPQGLAGKDGVDGKEGLMGPKGDTGAVGPQGLPGKDGVDGKEGLMGPKGDTGAVGSQGLAGKDGVDGKEGLMGPKGDTGAVGPQGPQGLSGKDGVDGKNGVDGKDGIQGPIGPKGDKGDQGIPGKDGLDGKNGVDGKDGATGPIGPKGETGNGFKNGANPGEIMYWNGNEWVSVNAGKNGQSLIFCDGKPIWVSGGVCPELGTIQSLLCNQVSNLSIIADFGYIKGNSNPSFTGNINGQLAYEGGNGKIHYDRIYYSTGLTGLSLFVNTGGQFANGSGVLNYILSGNPASSGTASFEISIGGQTCTLNFNVQVTNVYTETPVTYTNPTLELKCNETSVSANLLVNQVATGNVQIPYAVISYADCAGSISIDSLNISSYGVEGLSLRLDALSLACQAKSGSLDFSISGTPTSVGTANFDLIIAGQNCKVSIQVADNSSQQPTSGYGPNITDVENNTYKTVYIGTQQWMGENLKVSKYNDGTDIPYVTDIAQWSILTTGALGYYNNDLANNTKYGKLYNWYAVSPSTNGNKNVCPTGWHVPTDAEWTVLTDYLGGASVAGSKMKEVSTTSWSTDNTDATNTSLFTGLPGGYRYENGSYDWVGTYGSWWSSTVYKVDSAWAHSLRRFNGIVNRYYPVKSNGLSIRCLKD